MITFKQFLLEQNLGNLIGAQSGGAGGNWGGSLPKLISLLPMGNWYAGSQKRNKRNTASGGMSDHYTGNSIAYACDFGLSSTFKGNKSAATNFAIAVGRNAGVNIQSWDPYVGKHLVTNTQDGFRVQIIWLSNVGGNHYDHVHLGVRKGRGTPSEMVGSGTDEQSQEEQPSQEPSSGLPGDFESIEQAAQALVGGARSILSGGMGVQ